MALIKCNECGKEISDMASTCPNCGYPLNRVENNSQEVIVITMPLEKKEWENLNSSEKQKIIIYMKEKKEWWTNSRIIGIVLASIGLFFEAISMGLGFEEKLFMFIGIPFIFGALIAILYANGEQKKWYYKNRDILYKEEILK